MHFSLALLLVFVACASAKVVQFPLESAMRFPHKYLKENDMPAHYKLRLAAKNSAGEHIKDYDDILYIANVQVGTPAQTFRVDMDTGSSNFWIPDSGCLVHSCLHKRKFMSSNSSTYVANGQVFSINYGGGLQAIGILGQDKLCLGDSMFCITNQVFGQAENVYGRFYPRIPNDGMLGLGWPAIAVDHVTPPMQNLLPQLDAPLFNVWLNTVGGTSVSNNGGMITYGALDTVNCGSVTYVPLTSQTYWMFQLNGVSVGTYSSNVNQNAIADTGTSFIGGPNAVVDSIAAQIGATFNFTNLLYMLPCNKNTTAPNMVLTIGNAPYTISATNYMEPFGSSGKCYLQLFKFGGGGFGPQWVLGGAFMRNYCNTFNIGAKTIGFSTSIPSSSSG